MNTIRTAVRGVDPVAAAMAYVIILFLALVTVIVISGSASLLRTAFAKAPAPTTLTHDLTGLKIADTEAIICGEDSNAETKWVNDLGETIYITKAQVWMGMYKGSISDFAVWVQRNERPSTMMHTNWDHYVDPASPDHYIQMDYSPHHVAVKPGESISMNTFCSNMEDSNAVGHAVLTIWYYQ